jgi:molybdenum cofactor cytidylyltransferase
VEDAEVSCTGVVLAAGNSTRFGGDKLLFRYRGRPLVWWAAEALRLSGLEVYIVTARREVASAAGKADGIVYNPWWRLGLSTSVKAAVAALLDRRCIVWMLGDMPCVKPSTVSTVAEALQKRARGAYVQRSQGEPRSVV